VTSGIRVGTPALTTRGMKENEMRRIGELMVQTLEKVGDDSLHAKTRKKVRELCDQFPLHLELTKQ
jgi:glycine hydroxymethyltransferase